MVAQSRVSDRVVQTAEFGVGGNACGDVEGVELLPDMHQLNAAVELVLRDTARTRACLAFEESCKCRDG